MFQDWFGLTPTRRKGIEAQTRNSSLLFESIPMLFLQIFIYVGYIDVGFFDGGNSEKLLAISLVTTVASTSYAFFTNYLEAKTL